MQVEWFGQSVFSLTGAEAKVFVDPFADMSSLAERGMKLEYPPVEADGVDLLLITHEHRDHNGVEAIGGDPSALRPEQAAALGDVDLLFLPVGGGPTIGAVGAAAIVAELEPRWVVPMHYRTPRIGFLESEAEFVGLIDRVERFDDPRFDTAGLPVEGSPIAVAPAAP